MDPAARPHILVLCLGIPMLAFNVRYDAMLTAMRAVAQVMIVTTALFVQVAIEDFSPTTIMVADVGIFGGTGVMDTLFEFTERGGRVVLGFQLVRYATATQLNT